jgi:hypothetical protein
MDTTDIYITQLKATSMAVICCTVTVTMSTWYMISYWSHDQINIVMFSNIYHSWRYTSQHELVHTLLSWSHCYMSTDFFSITHSRHRLLSTWLTSDSSWHLLRQQLNGLCLLQSTFTLTKLSTSTLVIQSGYIPHTQSVLQSTEYAIMHISTLHYAHVSVRHEYWCKIHTSSHTELLIQSRMNKCLLSVHITIVPVNIYFDYHTVHCVIV